MNNGKQAALEIDGVAVGDRVTLGPGRFASMEVIPSPFGRVTLESYYPGGPNNPDAMRTEFFLERAATYQFDDPSCQPAIAAWGDQSLYSPNKTTLLFNGHISGNVQFGRFVQVSRKLFFGGREVGFVKSVSFGGVAVDDPTGNVVFVPSGFKPNVVVYTGEQVFRVDNRNWSGSVSVTVTLTHNYIGQPVTPVDYSYELDIPTLFQLPGCGVEECRCSAGTCEKYTSLTISQQQVYLDPPPYWNCGRPQIMVPATVDLPVFKNRHCPYYEDSCEWEVRNVQEDREFLPGRWRFKVSFFPDGTSTPYPPDPNASGYIIAQYDRDPDAWVCGAFFEASFAFSPCVFTSKATVRAYFRGDEDTYPYFYTDLTIESVNQALP